MAHAVSTHSVTILAGIGQRTDAIAHHSVYAVFVLMALDALLPVGGELIMLYAGVVAAGVVWGQHATLFSVSLATRRPIIDRHGRLLHISSRTFGRAENWFERYGKRAVFLARITPVVRSFISIPAGVFATPLAPYTLLTLLRSMLWCFSFAAVGWAVGGRWENFHHSFRYADYAAVALLLVLAGAALLHCRRHSRTSA